MSTVKKEVPMREVVRIVIIKDQKICLCKKPMVHGSKEFRVFPGGGVDKADDDAAIVRECLEEVGILVEPGRYLGTITTPNTERTPTGFSDKYSGTVTRYYQAKFIRNDHSLHGKDNDAMDYTWETIPDAIRILKAEPYSTFKQSRLDALSKIV